MNFKKKLTVVIQSNVAAVFAGAFPVPPTNSSGASWPPPFLDDALPVDTPPPGVAVTSSPANDLAGDEKSWTPAAAVLGIAADVSESVPSLRTASIGLGLAATCFDFFFFKGRKREIGVARRRRR